MRTTKTAWELYNGMSEEHIDIIEMSSEDKKKRCLSCRHLNSATFSCAYSIPCSSCIGSPYHLVCVDEDYFESSGEKTSCC